MGSFPEPIESVLLIGPTGAGKTPLGGHLEKSGINGRRCFHFDFGHELRGIAERALPPEGFEGDEHSFVRDVLKKGLLLENEHFPIARKIVRRFLKRKDFGGGDLLILNGLPRHKGQAGDMDSVVRISGLIVLECSAEEVFRRIQDNTGKDRTGREDDDIDMVRKKLGIFRDRTEPLIEHYAGKGRSILTVRVTASSSVQDMYSDLLSLAAGRLH